jgi:hypothetical protein
MKTNAEQTVTQVAPAVERDRRGEPLPPRQRVGGIITPQ